MIAKFGIRNLVTNTAGLIIFMGRHYVQELQWPFWLKGNTGRLASIACRFVPILASLPVLLPPPALGARLIFWGNIALASKGEAVLLVFRWPFSLDSDFRMTIQLGFRFLNYSQFIFVIFLLPNMTGLSCLLLPRP